MRISRAPRVDVTAPAEWITGSATISELASPEGDSRTQVDSVRFAPGARTRWHRHPLGQVLVVTEGTGHVQRRGGRVETIRPGDTVRIAADEWHWHGAVRDSAMTHLAIEELPADGRTAELGDVVTEEEYGATAEATGTDEAGETIKADEADEVDEAGAADEPEPPFSRLIVMDQKLPEPLAIHRVEVRRITVAPGFAAGLHIHNGPVFGNIETGSAIYQIEGEPENVLMPGDTFYEPEGVRIARFDAQAEGVTFLGYFPLAEGVDAELVIPEA